MPGNLFTAVTISRRSAAEGGADAPLMPSKTARHTASTLKSASDQLSGGYRAVVRAECTAARPLAHRHQQPNQPSQQDEHEAAASAEDRPFSSARRGGIADRAFWCTKRRFFRQTGVSAPKFSSPAARLWGLRPAPLTPHPAPSCMHGPRRPSTPQGSVHEIVGRFLGSPANNCCGRCSRWLPLCSSSTAPAASMV